jgi:hypothetical protein
VTLIETGSEPQVVTKMRGRKQTELENHRKEVLSTIRGEQLALDVMAQRATTAGETPDPTLLAATRKRLAEIEDRATRETDDDELDGLIEDAQQQGQFRAYLCPLPEIQHEGDLIFDLMEEWNIPKTITAKVRALLGPDLRKAKTDPRAARGALRALFEERDSWENYTDEYEKTMRQSTVWLFVATIVLLLLAIVLLQFSRSFVSGSLFLSGLLIAGAAGSCVSVMAKMPMFDVGLSGELESYIRRILSRIGVGVAASLIGCALLGWGLIPISVQNQTFAEALTSCSTPIAGACTVLKTLILLGVAMVFGFSERALTSFEQRVLGK